MKEIPNDQRITYQFQHRKCGKTSCSTCRNGQGHGPYWYAYWREGSRLRSGYVGKINPHETDAAPSLNEEQVTIAPIVIAERTEEVVLV
ncbi:MAG: hypothetical protein NVS4B12_12050 [Ktedonobacteraceae bacterium]